MEGVFEDDRYPRSQRFGMNVGIGLQTTIWKYLLQADRPYDKAAFPARTTPAAVMLFRRNGFWWTGVEIPDSDGFNGQSPNLSHLRSSASQTSIS